MNRKYKPFHIKLLEAELSRRKRENPQFSLRAFARFLEMSSSSLSRILLDSQEISISTSKQIIKKLNLSDEDSVLFIASIAEDKRRRAFQLLSSELQGKKQREDMFNPINPEWILSNSPDLVMVFNRKKQFLYLNEEGAKYLRRSPEELIGKSISDTECSFCTIKFDTLLEDTFASALTIKIEDTFSLKKDEMCFEKIFIPVRNNDDKEVQAVACHLRDITDKKEAELRLAILAKTGSIFSSSYDYNITLHKITKYITKEFVDGCFIHIMDSEQQVKVFEVEHREPHKVEILKALFEHFPYDPVFPYFYHNVFSTGKPKLFKHVAESSLENVARDRSHFENLVKLEVGSYICVPMTALGKTIGTITLLRSKESRDFNDEDLKLALELGSRAAWVVDCENRLAQGNFDVIDITT